MKTKISEVTAQGFEEEVLNARLPVLLEFTSDTCPPCKMLKPILNQLAETYEGQLQVRMIDNDTNHSLVKRYGVMGLPTTILFVDGEPVERIVGFTPKGRIESVIRPYLIPENA